MWKRNPSADELARFTLGRDMVEFLKRGEKALDGARKALSYLEGHPNSAADAILDSKQIRLMAPVPRPGALVSAGKNFSDHVAEMASKKGPSSPVAFLKLPGTVIGPEDDIPHPPEVKNLDYEVELAIVIGKPCVDVSEDEALDYVAGYSAFNDISARDVIRGENKTGIHLMGKSFPGFAPMGPVSCHRRRDSRSSEFEVETVCQQRNPPGLELELHDFQDSRDDRVLVADGAQSRRRADDRDAARRCRGEKAGPDTLVAQAGRRGRSRSRENRPAT